VLQGRAQQKQKKVDLLVEKRIDYVELVYCCPLLQFLGHVLYRIFLEVGALVLHTQEKKYVLITILQ